MQLGCQGHAALQVPLCVSKNAECFLTVRAPRTCCHISESSERGSVFLSESCEVTPGAGPFLPGELNQLCQFSEMPKHNKPPMKQAPGAGGKGGHIFIWR